MNERFLKLPYILLQTTGFVSPVSRQEVKLTLTDKVLYSYIKNRFDFFTKDGKLYFDTQQSIAEACSLDIKTVGNSIRKFTKEGLTDVQKRPTLGGKYLSNVYTNVRQIEVVK